ncbi:MAG: helix-turn-helix domain-containing protein [Streptomycetaceae bacterium]|nr:helix-turn-helix domain-containing protein [Streptomycetaceae bacterium]
MIGREKSRLTEARDAERQAHLLKEHTIADLAELFSVSRATVYRVLERARDAS